MGSTKLPKCQCLLFPSRVRPNYRNQLWGKTGVTAYRDKIEFRLFDSSSIFNITLREECLFAKGYIKDRTRIKQPKLNLVTVGRDSSFSSVRHSSAGIVALRTDD